MVDCDLALVCIGVEVLVLVVGTLLSGEEAGWAAGGGKGAVMLELGLGLAVPELALPTAVETFESLVLLLAIEADGKGG